MFRRFEFFKDKTNKVVFFVTIMIFSVLFCSGRIYAFDLDTMSAGAERAFGGRMTRKWEDMEISAGSGMRSVVQEAGSEVNDSEEESSPEKNMEEAIHDEDVSESEEAFHDRNEPDTEEASDDESSPDMEEAMREEAEEAGDNDDEVGVEKNEDETTDEGIEAVDTFDPPEESSGDEGEVEEEQHEAVDISDEAEMADIEEEEMIDISQIDITEEEVLASLIWCEAGNQPYEGRVAVAEVVMNRVHSDRFPNTIVEVILQPGQFEYRLDAIVNEENLDIARRVMSGEEQIFENADVQYFRNSMITSGIPQSEPVDWGAHRWYSYIEGHAFYTC